MKQESDLSSNRPPETSDAAVVGLVERVCSEFHIMSLDLPIKACKTLFTEDPVIDVAILGQFKAGKSSFINSLIGKDVLPVGVIPVTTVITRLRYGPQEKAAITYLDGKTSETALDRVDEYISELKNQANKKNVEVVDLEFPPLEPYKGLRFVDTPPDSAASSDTTRRCPRTGCPGWDVPSLPSAPTGLCLKTTSP